MDFNLFINDLIKNINIDNVPREIDLVLDGGAFNGAFQLGALLYLKQMEKNKMIKIKRVSGTSIGAILGFLFIVDRLDYSIQQNYETWRNYRKTLDLSCVRESIINFMIDIDKDIYKKINKRLYITYFNVDKKKQIVKYKYKNNQEILSSIIKSSHVPYFIDGNYTYKKKYIDGVYPYIFGDSHSDIYHTAYKRKILFICLSQIKSINFIGSCMSIKNEFNGFERILYGINDIHMFFKQHYELLNQKNNSKFCNYINNFRIIDWIYFKSRFVFVLIIMYIVEIKNFIKHLCDIKLRENKMYYCIFNNIMYTDIIMFIKKYIKNFLIDVIV